MTACSFLVLVWDPHAVCAIFGTALAYFAAHTSSHEYGDMTRNLEDRII